MAIFSKCEVSDGPHGKQVVATAPVDPGTALVIDEEVIFAVECQHMQSRCALCCCTCEEEVTGVACKACDARCARDPSLQRWADAAQLLGPAQGSVALCAAALAAGTIDFSKLVQDSRELDSRTLQIFQLVAGNLGRITKRTEEDCFACIQACRLNAHALVDHAAGPIAGLDRFDDLTGVQLGQLISEPLSRFDHACDANAYLSVDIRPGLPIRATVRSLHAISPNEPVTLCYLPHAGNTTEIRRQRLQEAYDFKCECRLCASTTLDALLRCPRGPPEEAIKCLDGAWTALSVDNNEAADEIGKRADDAWRALPPTHGFKLQLDLLRITTKARLRASDLDLRCRMFLGALAVSPELTVAATDPLTRARVLFLGGDVDAARALAAVCLGVDGARAAFPN